MRALVDIRPLSDSLQGLRRISSRYKEAIVAGTLEGVTYMQASDEMERILEWLKYDSVDSFQRISSLLNDRAKGTCLWFLENHAFVDLMEGQRRERATKMLFSLGTRTSGCIFHQLHSSHGEAFGNL